MEKGQCDLHTLTLPDCPDISKRRFVLNLPIPMPTLNRVLEMHHKERMRLKKWMRQCGYLCAIYAIEQQTSTISLQNISSMGLSIAAYYKMINRKSCPNLDKPSDERTIITIESI